MLITIFEEWEEDNYHVIVAICCRINPEIRIQQLGKRLILSDPEFDFRRVYLKGDEIFIPKRTIIEEDEFELEEET